MPVTWTAGKAIFPMLCSGVNPNVPRTSFMVTHLRAASTQHW